MKIHNDHKKIIYSWKDYKDLLSYARKRTQSEQDYFSFEKYQGTLITRYLLNMGVPVAQSHALDIGCGFGGYTSAIREAGSDIIGLDLDTTKLSRLALKVTGNALRTPFPGGRFSLVICASLIEHVADPDMLLTEIDRLMKPKGYLYLSFPPFYSPTGGHQFAPYHYLGERLAIAIFNLHTRYQKHEWLKQHISFNPKSFTNSFGSWGLYRRTINWAKREIKKYSWDLIDCSARYMPINPTFIPVVREFLTWHVQFLVQKQ